MLDETFIQAQALRITLDELNAIKTDLATSDGLTSFTDLINCPQSVIMLTKSKLPRTPPAALTTALAAVESFLLAQAITAIDDQIDAAQTSFDELQDPES